MRPPINVIKKICVLGEPFVGKSSLIQRYVLNEYTDVYKPTIGSQVLKKTITLDFQPERPQQVNLTFLIFDLIGHTEFMKLLKAYFMGAEGAFIVSDLTRDQTIMNMMEWHDSFKEVVGDVPIIYLGNKTDIAQDHNENKELLQEIARDRDQTCIFTSAKTGDYVEETFRMLGARMINKLPVL